MRPMTFVIFHGAFGHADGNWFPYVKKELLALGQNVILEQFPVEDFDQVTKAGKSYKPTMQNLTNWFNTFEDKILPKLKGNEKICFIGHSLSPLFILHILQRYAIQLDSAIFVEPFMTSLKTDDGWQFDIVNDTFYKSDFDFMKLRKLIPISYVVWSDNDKYVPKKIMFDFADKLGSSTIQLKNAFHINAPLFTKLSLVVELCKTRLNPILYLK